MYLHIIILQRSAERRFLNSVESRWRNSVISVMNTMINLYLILEIYISRVNTKHDEYNDCYRKHFKYRWILKDYSAEKTKKSKCINCHLIVPIRSEIYLRQCTNIFGWSHFETYFCKFFRFYVTCSISNNHKHIGWAIFLGYFYYYIRI